MQNNMNPRRTLWSRLLPAFLLLALSLGVAQQSQAQYTFRWLNVGDFQHRFYGGGAQPEIYNPFPTMLWPGIQATDPGGVSYMHGLSTWISAKNFTDENGTAFPVRVSHVGPRFDGVGEFFEEENRLISQWEAPSMTVDGLDTFKDVVAIDEIDPNLKPDRMVINTVNSSVGVTMKRTAMQWSNQYHDDYHITEYLFTNTGNVDDDEEIELPNQVLEDVFFTFIRRPKTSASSASWDNSEGGSAWGHTSQTDILGNGENDYGLDWRGFFTFMRHSPEKTVYSTIGAPMWSPGSWWYSLQTDTTGRLGAAAMHGEIIFHADSSPHAPGVAQADDPAQPYGMSYMNADDADLTGASNHNNIQLMELERDWIERGAPARPNYPGVWSNAPPRAVPSQIYGQYPAAGPIETSEDFINHFATTDDPAFTGNWMYSSVFGPFDMQPGEEYRVVMFDGVAGLSLDLSIELGQWYRRRTVWEGRPRAEADALLFSWDPKRNVTCTEGAAGCISLTKDQWVMTTRDSLFSLIERARANYDGGYNVIAPPKPPSSFAVNSGPDRITISWVPTEQPAGGWELYRAQNRYLGIPAPFDEERYVKIADLPPGATSYEDTDVGRNVAYFYYLTAVGGSNSIDPMGLTGTPDGSPLKSSRYFSQSYDPAFLKRAPGSTLEAARVVPNPYNLGANAQLRWPDQQNKIAFLDIPGNSTIEIYTELGELVTTILHNDGSGDENWNLTTDSNQLIVSGIYLAVIVDNDTGDKIVRKFAVIR